MMPSEATSRALRWIGALGIATIAIIRCVLVFSGQIVFDVDPAIDPSPLPGFGPAGSLFLDAALLAACGCGLLGETLAGRSIDRVLLAIALVPAPVIAYHGLADAGDMWRGSTWLAAAIACVVLAHLGRDRAIRVVILGLLVAVLVPVAIRGALQSSVSLFGVTWSGPEYVDTVAEYETHRDVFLADRGWAPDSAAARLYEQRLRQPDPRGWFPTTNVFASAMAFGLVMSIGLAIGAVRDRTGARWLTLFATAAIVLAVSLLVSRSKGAILAGMIGLALVVVPLASRHAHALLTRRGAPVMLALVGLTLAAVVVRGVALPESWLGEKSLLYRWHYLVGSARIVSGHTMVGVGPDGYQAAYVAARMPRSPEEVTSAHNVFADWLSDLGLSGVAWVALVGVLLWRAGRRLDPDDDTVEDGSGFVRSRWTLAAAGMVAVVALAPATMVEAAIVNSAGKELARIAGILGFVLAAVALTRGLERTRGTIVTSTLSAAAAVLVVQGQIEMTFFDPGAVTWVMCVLGLAGGVSPTAGGRRTGFGVAAGLMVLAVVLASTVAAAASRAQSRMIAAAELLYPTARQPEQHAWQREEAARMLIWAYDAVRSTDAMTLRAAALQTMFAAQVSMPDRRVELATRAVELAGKAAGTHPGPSSTAVLAEAAWLLAAITGDETHERAAIDAAMDLTDLDPHGIGPWRRLGDLLWELDIRDEAATAYQRALDNDANFELDPMRQLSERDREQLTARADVDRRKP